MQTKAERRYREALDRLRETPGDWCALSGYLMALVELRLEWEEAAA